MFLIDPFEELIKKVENIFQQGDSRYRDPEGSVELAFFIEKKAIEIKKVYILDIETTDQEEKGIKGPQRDFKAIAKRILKKERNIIVGYERSFPRGVVDILAEDNKGNTIIVECCSCRVDKAIKYLEEENTILWILSHSDENLFPVVRLPLFIIKKGPNWSKVYKIYQQYKKEKMNKFKNPLDSLLEEKNDK